MLICNIIDIINRIGIAIINHIAIAIVNAIVNAIVSKFITVALFILDEEWKQNFLTICIE